ncbi:hypothetical protein [Notoacmeibacter sp. MSK16QG-6]|uniref:hypothetical protein n=1 Tax=Notoacmeibacter sp. MSK16QG-6 TaxID=2957982 RepID=UPI00209ECE06|nr:hypothetical protein [Notoacmeibacter sp. MSK16QG-6]MCP1200058.1 hypothetical protein [Notoacmeibacter sp. MSK16QG-6]
MTPARAIAMLDRQIARHGETVTLKRVAPNAPAVTHDVKAFMRGYSAEELIGGIAAGDSEIALSPTSLAGSAFEAALPERGDQVTAAGRLRRIEFAVPVRLDGTLVRMNLTVRG